MESSREDVCTNCGLVFQDRPIAKGLDNVISNGKKNKDWKKEITFSSKLSPDLKYMKPSFKKYYDKSDDDYKFLIAYTEINRICENLQLTNIVRLDALNIYRCIRKNFNRFFVKFGNGSSFGAFIYTAAKINNVFINKKELLEQIENSEKFKNALMHLSGCLGIYNFCPKKPSYISYVCETLELEFEKATKIYEIFAKIRNRFNTSYKIEGYILALYSILFGITITKLSETFNIASLTISPRRKELKRMLNEKM